MPATATLDLVQLLPRLSWPIIFLSTLFASSDFIERFRARASVVGALEDATLVAICRAVLAHDSRHIADWFGSGHQACRLLANRLRRHCRLAARAQILTQLAAVDAIGPPAWKQNGAWRPKAAILSDLRRYWGTGLYQANQLWLLLCFVRHTYPQAADREIAEAGPGARRGILYLMQYPIGRCQTAEDVASRQLFFYLSADLQHKALSHIALRITTGDTAAIRRAKDEVRNLFQRRDGFNF